MTYKVKKDDRPFILNKNKKVVNDILVQNEDLLAEGKTFGGVMLRWHKQDAGKILPYGQLKSNLAYFLSQRPGFGSRGGKVEGTFKQSSIACNTLAKLGILCEV